MVHLRQQQHSLSTTQSSASGFLKHKRAPPPSSLPRSFTSLPISLFRFPAPSSPSPGPCPQFPVPSSPVPSSRPKFPVPSLLPPVPCHSSLSQFPAPSSRRECDLPAARATLFLLVPLFPLVRLISSHPSCEFIMVTCASRHTKRPYPCKKKQPSAEIVRVEGAKCRRECDLSGPRATLCGDRACRVREMQAKVRFGAQLQCAEWLGSWKLRTGDGSATVVRGVAGEREDENWRVGSTT